MSTPPADFPTDFLEQNARYKAACGHGAAAAAVGWSVNKIRPLFLALVDEGKTYVNQTMMKAALEGTRRPWRDVGKFFPAHGVVLIQFTGHRLSEGVPGYVQSIYTHWIAVREGGKWVWDVNGLEADPDYCGWITREQWEQEVKLLYPTEDVNGKPVQCTGWKIKRGFEVDLPAPVAGPR